MKRLFILFVVLHLLMDLALPSAGAFRLNPDESVVGLRVQPVQAQELAAPPQGQPRRSTVDLPRLALKVPADFRGSQNLPDIIPLLPRRDPSADRSLPSPTDPA